MTKKRTAAKRSKGNGWKGVPSAERKRVRLVMAAHAYAGKTGNPQDIYLRLAQLDAQSKATAEERERKQIEDLKKERIATARKEIGPAFMKLSAVRNLLSRIEEGEDDYFSTEESATFARAVLAEAGTELEQALFDLGVYRGCAPEESTPEGWFVPEFLDTAKPRVNSEPAATTS